MSKVVSFLVAIFCLGYQAVAENQVSFNSPKEIHQALETAFAQKLDDFPILEGFQIGPAGVPYLDESAICQALTRKKLTFGDSSYSDLYTQINGLVRIPPSVYVIGFRNSWNKNQMRLWMGSGEKSIDLSDKNVRVIGSVQPFDGEDRELVLIKINLTIDGNDNRAEFLNSFECK
jgi:hypothetical protein